MLSRCLDDADDFQSPMLKYIDPGKSFAHQAAWGYIFMWYVVSVRLQRTHSSSLSREESHNSTGTPGSQTLQYSLLIF